MESNSVQKLLEELMLLTTAEELLAALEEYESNNKR